MVLDVLNRLRGVCGDLRWCTRCFREVFEGFRDDRGGLRSQVCGGLRGN